MARRTLVSQALGFLGFESQVLASMNFFHLLVLPTLPLDPPSPRGVLGLLNLTLHPSELSEGLSSLEGPPCIGVEAVPWGPGRG